ncbi:MAG: hypothetical protein E7430_03580 [Ruminococcaceae bacterium]|nr:hypothetical protein [Oscillospiraceae bacterium]
MRKKKSFIGFLNLPKGMTRRLYLKNLISLALLLVLAIAAFTLHTTGHSMWIRNYMSEGYQLDEAQLESIVGYVDVQPGELNAIDSNMLVANMGIPSMVEQGYVYFQDEKDYRFALPVDSVEETGIYYDDTYTPYFGVTDVNAWLAEVEALPPINYEVSGSMAEYFIMPLSRLVRVTSGDAQMLVLMSYDAEIAVGDVIRGIFTSWNDFEQVEEYKLGTLPFPEYYLTDYAHSLYLKGESSDRVLGYIFETMDVPVEFEDENWGYMVFYGIITGFVLLLNAVFYIWPKFHPFFRQMARYGTVDEVTASIDEEFAEGKKFIENKKTLLSDTWYIKRSAFMNVINRNPNMVPENQREREGSVNKRRYSDYTEQKLPTEDNYDPLKENMKNRYNKYY